MTDLLKYFDIFQNKKIAVIGDLILDKYIFGQVVRISPEAPIPIVRVQKESFAPGGAANVATNIATLSGNVFLFGIVGKDHIKETLFNEAHAYSINTDGIIIDKSKTTIHKIRIIGQNQQLLRVDYETKNYTDKNNNCIVFDKLSKISGLSAIVISDYAKGTITKKLMVKVKNFAIQNNILLIIDPKPSNKDFYKDAFLITPNKKEAQEMSNISIESAKDFLTAGRKLVEEFKANIIITAGELGMFVFNKNKEHIHIPTVAKDVYDVSGAGDTVVASLALALSSGASLSESAIIGNYAAGIKVSKIGTKPVYLEELKNGKNNNEEKQKSVEYKKIHTCM